MSDSPSQTYALIIGINFYQSTETSVFKSLWGCVDDAQSMYQHIKKYVGESALSNNVKYLTSTAHQEYSYYFDRRGRPRDGKPVTGPRETDKSKLPTYENIVRELRDLYTKAGPGDTVFFSYSGHGDRLPTEIDEPGWESKTAASAQDEVICPYDIAINGDGVRDWELNWLLGRIAKNGVKLTVFLDSCNSGGAIRGQLAHVEPGQGEGGEILPPPMPRVLPRVSIADTAARGLTQYRTNSPIGTNLGEIKAAWDDLMSKSNISRGGMGVLRIPPMGYTCFTGCLAHELSWEDDGRGALTHAAISVLQILNSLPPHVIRRVATRNLYRYIFDRVYKKWYDDDTKKYLYQTPLLLGPQNRPFPGVKPNGAPFISITREQEEFARGLVPVHQVVDGMTSLLFLRAGRAHGVEIGAEYGVWLWHENPEAGSQPGVRVVVTATEEVVSVVHPVPQGVFPSEWQDLYALEGAGNKKNTWPTGCVASLLSRPRTNDPKKRDCLVQLVGDVDGLTDQLYSPGLLPIMFTRSETANCDFRIANTTTPKLYELQSPDGTPLVPPASLFTCVESARHIAQHNLLKEHKGTSSKAIKDCFKLTSNTAPANPQDGYTYVRFEWLRKDEDHTTMTPHANISLFHFSGAPEYRVRRIYPQDGEFESLDEGLLRDQNGRIIGSEGDKREVGFQGSGGMIKAVVSFTSTGFGAWALGSVEGVKKEGKLDTRALALEKDEAVAAGNNHKADVRRVIDDDEWSRFAHWCTLDL